TVAALNSPALDECSLNWMKRRAISDTLDRQDCGSLCSKGRVHARVDGETIDQHSAAPTATCVATAFRPCQPEAIAEHGGEAFVWTNGDCMKITVDFQLDHSKLATIDGPCHGILDRASFKHRRRQTLRTRVRNSADPRKSWMGVTSRSINSTAFRMVSSLS